MNIYKECEQYFLEKAKNDEYSDRQEVLFFDEHVNFLNQCGKVLDLGCGTGNASKHILAKYIKYVGITHNQLEVDEAKKRGIDVRYGDMHNLSFLKGSMFDGAIMWDSLEHCVAPFIALKEAKKYLTYDGKLLIFMPGRNWINEASHLHVMYPDQMMDILYKAGFYANCIIKHYPKGTISENVDYTGMAVYECITR